MRLSNKIKALIGYDHIAIEQNSYKNTVATVRIGNELHSEEHRYVIKRKKKVKKPF